MLWLTIILIVILNILCVFLMYKFLEDIEKKEKIIFIASGIAIMYVLTLLAHFISTMGLDEIYKSGSTKDFVIFLFVPINGLLVLPTFAKSYYNYKLGKLKLSTLKKRICVLIIPLLIALILEGIFLKNIQIFVTNNIYNLQS